MLTTTLALLATVNRRLEAVAPVAAPSDAGLVQELDELRDSTAMTDDEFESQRAQILAEG